jgi:hypothetical protein
MQRYKQKFTPVSTCKPGVGCLPLYVELVITSEARTIGPGLRFYYCSLRSRAVDNIVDDAVLF